MLEYAKGRDQLNSVNIIGKQCPLPPESRITDTGLNTVVTLLLKVFCIFLHGICGTKIQLYWWCGMGRRG
jgi:hypothetical protein